MIIKKTFIAAALLALLPVAAFANGGNSCAEAVEIYPHQSYDSDTAAAGSANPILDFGGPFGSAPNNDRIFKFTARSAAGAITINSANYNFAVFLSNGCAQSGLLPLNAVAGPAVPASLPLVDEIGGTGALVDGTTYYVVATGNPGGQGAGDAPRNGALNFTTPDTLPVTLRNFSID